MICSFLLKKTGLDSEKGFDKNILKLMELHQNNKLNKKKVFASPEVKKVAIFWAVALMAIMSLVLQYDSAFQKWPLVTGNIFFIYLCLLYLIKWQHILKLASVESTFSEKEVSEAFTAFIKVAESQQQLSLSTDTGTTVESLSKDFSSALKQS